MFTGIIEELGLVECLRPGAASTRLTIRAMRALGGTRIGDSVAVAGVCLTVTDLAPASFSADVMAETLARSGLGRLRAGSAVNLERALTLSSRLGGHLVSGHIDGVGIVAEVSREDIAWTYGVECEPSLLRYVAVKGSVALDGASLTVRSVSARGFSVSVIPHTAKSTTIGELRRGDRVNVECDLIAKYLERLAIPSVANGSARLTEGFFRLHGFTEE